ncbi:MAG: type II toxin-antitoxin system VapC family toxin [Anaerolineales bacterium]|jgi:tRNA(fMet)-specific endonuclease VapC
MKYLFDTCIISELVSKQPSARVVEWVDSLDTDDVYLSVLTIGEIIKGIEKLPKSRRKTELHTWLKEDLLARFQGKIIPVDTDVIVEWGILTAHVESAGKPMPAIDALIAATAKVNQLTLVTRNVSDFNAADMKVLNPWD